MRWDVRPGRHERLARQSDDPLVWAATGGRWQNAAGGFGNINADDGEVSIVEFKNVGAARGRPRELAVGVWVWADASNDGHISDSVIGLMIAGVGERRPNLSCSHFGCKWFCWDFESVTKTAHSQLSKIFCDHIRTLRERAQMTQRDLAAAIGREHGMIGRIELGERRVDLAEAYQILTALGTEPDEAAAQIMRKFAKAMPKLA